MARNVQVKENHAKRRRLRARRMGIGLIFVAFLSFAAGCGKAPELESEYDFSARRAAFACEAEDETAAAFAESICVVSGADDAEPAVTGDAAAVFDLSGGTALFHKNAFERMNPASTTKIMTALLAIRYGNLADPVTATDAVVIHEAGSSMAGIVPGDTLTLEQLLYGLLLPSGNDAANAIAVHIAGSVPAFAEMMNGEARRIGATGTHFVNANGLTDADHYTTAYDLYLMFREALKYDTFRRIIGAQTYTASYTGADGQPASKTWNVTNLYMLGRKEIPDGLTVFGGKTGTTQAAGYCLIMGSRTVDGSEYASVVMSADSRNALYDDMTKIISKIAK